MQANPPDAGYVTYDLEQGSEWRFELEENEALAVRVSSRVVIPLSCLRRACCGIMESLVHFCKYRRQEPCA
jgi:hypothetical protein